MGTNLRCCLMDTALLPVPVMVYTFRSAQQISVAPQGAVGGGVRVRKSVIGGKE